MIKKIVASQRWVNALLAAVFTTIIISLTRTSAAFSKTTAPSQSSLSLLRRGLLSQQRAAATTATSHSSPFLFSASNSRPGAASSRSSVVSPSFVKKNTALFTQQQLRGGSSSTATRLTPLSSTATAETTTTMASPTSAETVDALRKRMKELNLDVYLVPTDDPHLSEYVPEAYMRRAFLTHFKGSAGTAVVTQDGAAYLWTDSRYWNEASLQLDGAVWTLQKAGLPETKTISKWLGEHAAEHYQKHQRPLQVGCDPFVHSATFANDVEEAFKEAATDAGLDADDDNANKVKIGELATSNPNLIDEIWDSARPAIPTSPFRVHPIEYAGTSLKEKLDSIRSEMEKKKATLAVFCCLDDVAYLLNVRCMGDIDTCPVGIAYVTVTADACYLYCDERKVVAPDVQEQFRDVVTLKPYDAIVSDVAEHCKTKGSKVWIDKTRANYALVRSVPEKKLIGSQNAVTPMKAVKNEAELKGMRQAHIVDGAAMAHFLAWLENAVVNEGKKVSEVEIDERLTGERAKQPGFMEVSFPTIAGVGANGAIIHYRAETDNELMKYLDTSAPILIDSGGQYTYGTTDVTRTWYFGKEPLVEFQEYYTRVLKGHIGLDQIIFPDNTPGFVVDLMARRFLWSIGKDYGHGTGHGVGAALNVHEGPMSISPRYTNKEGLKQGMVVSNEPGYYEDGNFGIRIENLMEIQCVNPDDGAAGANGEEKAPKGKTFLRFSPLTMIPIQKNLINLDLMTDEELDWIDNYHAKVWEKVSPLLEQGSPGLKWLQKSCDKIARTA